MQIPKFSTLRADIDEKLEAIIQKALRRDRDQRYQSASEMLNDLELYLYSDGYGPTNEKLGTYMRDLFNVRDPQPPVALSELPRPPEP
jgi:serine/threonine protein kinase